MGCKELLHGMTQPLLKCRDCCDASEDEKVPARVSG
jgi:hypothetical protein